MKRILLFLITLPTLESFSTHKRFCNHWCCVSFATTKPECRVLLHASPNQNNWLMDDFKTADGVIINPYNILKLDRSASRTEIRESYRKLSKKYHPDAVRYRTIMPGSCDTLDEVRDQWERIKLSYEILSDKKLKLKYDRQSALHDPGKALSRAAFDTAGWGFTTLAKGIFSIGKYVVDVANTKNTIELEEQEEKL